MDYSAIALFTYNFPHRKTEEVVSRLFWEGVPIACMIAADYVQLNIPAPSVRTHIRHRDAVHPRELARRLNVPYYAAPHNSPETIRILKDHRIELGLIAGARILKSDIIEACGKGIVNLHPGLIPEARGLDTLLWSIRNDIPLGVTAHLIDSRVDAGQLLLKRTIKIYRDDTLFDLAERLNETQIDMLKASIEAAFRQQTIPCDFTGTSYYRKMPAELVKKALSKLPRYIERHAT